jgi:simple sugar transport system substrate-binding protein
MTFVRRRTALAAKKKLKFVFITPYIEEDFFKPVRKGMRDASRVMDVRSVFTGVVDTDREAQAAILRKAVADGCDGIAVSCDHPTALNADIREAMDAGVPVVGFNIDSGEPGRSRLSCVCQDLYNAGRSLGAAVAGQIADGSSALVTLHSEGNSALEDRCRGIQDALKGKHIIWTRVVTSTDPESAAEVILKALQRNEAVRTVLCTGQADTEGAGAAASSWPAGKRPLVAGFDLSPRILRFIQKGMIRMTVDQQPYIQGFYPVVQLALYCRFGIRPTDIDTGAAFIDAGNVGKVMEANRGGYR